MKLVVLSSVIAVCASTLAFAQNPASPPQQNGSMRSQFMDACGNDVKTYCASAQSRDDRRACVVANRDKFSGSCKAFMAAHPMHQHQPQGGQQ